MTTPGADHEGHNVCSGCGTCYECDGLCGHGPMEGLYAHRTGWAGDSQAPTSPSPHSAGQRPGEMGGAHDGADSERATSAGAGVVHEHPRSVPAMTAPGAPSGEAIVLTAWEIARLVPDSLPENQMLVAQAVHGLEERYDQALAAHAREREALRAEVDRLRDVVADLETDDEAERVAHYKSHWHAAAAALKRFGQHEAECRRVHPTRCEADPCSCGLDDALAAAPPPRAVAGAGRGTMGEVTPYTDAEIEEWREWANKRMHGGPYSPHPTWWPSIVKRWLATLAAARAEETRGCFDALMALQAGNLVPERNAQRMAIAEALTLLRRRARLAATPPPQPRAGEAQ